MRKIVEKAYHACYDKGANIVAFSYDGQWHNLITKGKDREPLTLHQLQLNVWNDISKHKKNDLVKILSQINHTGNVCAVSVGPKLILSGFINISINPSRTKPPKKSSAESATSPQQANSSIESAAAEPGEGDELGEEDKSRSGYEPGEGDQPEAGDELGKGDEPGEGDDTSNILSCIDSNVLSGLLDNSDFEAVVSGLAGDFEAVVSGLASDQESYLDMVTPADNDNENELPADQEMTHDIIEGQVSEQSKTESETLSTQGNNKSLISLSPSIADCIAIQRKWLPFSSSLKVIGPSELKQHLENPESMYKKLTIPELKSVVRWLQYKLSDQKIALSGTKQQLVVRLSHYLSSNADSDIISTLGNRSRLRKLSPASLSSQCSSFMCSKGYSKVALIAAYGKHIYHDKLNAWKAVGKTRINIDQEIPGYGSIVPFYIPERHPDTMEIIVGLVDHHHLFIRLRMTLIRGTITVVSKKHFMQVAISKSTSLTHTIMEGLEPQSESYARLTLSEEVEARLLKIGLSAEAEFCQLV